jgi:hypothetical protein
VSFAHFENRCGVSLSLSSGGGLDLQSYLCGTRGQVTGPKTAHVTHISFCHLGSDLYPEKDQQHYEYNVNCYIHHDPPHLPTLTSVCVPSRPPTASSRNMLGYWRHIDRHCRRGRIFVRCRRKVSPPSFATHRADFLGLRLDRVGLHL